MKLISKGAKCNSTLWLAMFQFSCKFVDALSFFKKGVASLLQPQSDSFVIIYYANFNRSQAMVRRMHCAAHFCKTWWVNFIHFNSIECVWQHFEVGPDDNEKSFLHRILWFDAITNDKWFFSSRFSKMEFIIVCINQNLRL